MENFKQHNKNLRYGQHVNDKFVIWLHAFHKLHKFQNHPNNHKPFTQFATETEMYHLYCITFGCLNKKRKKHCQLQLTKKPSTLDNIVIFNPVICYMWNREQSRIYTTGILPHLRIKRNCALWLNNFPKQYVDSTIRNFGIKGRPDTQSDNKHSGYPLCKECLRQI